MRLILVSAMTTASSCGIAPPDNDGPGAARHDIDLLVAAEPHDARDLLGRARQRHRERQAAVGGQRVGLEGAPAGFVGDEAFARQDRREARRRIASRRARMVSSSRGKAMWDMMPSHSKV